MHKPLFALMMSLMILLSGCTPALPAVTTNQIDSSSNYSYTWDMKNPGTQSTENLMMMQNGFKTTQKAQYKLTQEDVTNLSKDSCAAEFPVPVWADDLGIEIGKIQKSDLQVGKELSFDVPYEGPGLGLKFSQEQLNQLNTNGWMIMEANNELLDRIVNTINYDPNSIEPYTPEWAEYYNSIGGNTSPRQRYPYNTIYVSSDLLLHSYHKLFSNSLKAYEMTTARNLMSEVIDESLSHFAKLAQTNNQELKTYYEYLTAYWSIAKILLPEQQEIEQFIEHNRQLEYDNSDNTIIQNGDLTDLSIKNMITQRMKDIIQKYPTSYNKAVEDSVKEILAGVDNKKVDYLSQAFSPQTNPDFIVVQDYTQFVPRSHYTDNSYLKTYFMSMKWMMRHKMYTRDQRSSLAALILANDLPNNAQQKLEQLQSFIQKMIGADDDTNIQDIKQFLGSKKVSSDTDIVKNYNSERTADIAHLRPQKIISTSYTTPSEGSVSEQDAKIQTAGFVLFGEKFTPDAWMMDMFTAGSAEQESEIKPSVVSVYSLFEVFIGGNWADYAQQWFKTNKEKFEITDKQLAHYPVIIDEIKADLSGNTADTLYNDWIHLLKTATIIPKNPPAYMKGLSFIHKIANTILGSYTELKHDTLLYVKQAYAELGMGGDGDCAISITVPDLPVPKGYIEPQIDLIDNLLELSDKTSQFFGDTNKENFTLYHDYLSFIKSIAVQQTQNKIISDEDFEKLRLSSSVLTQIVSPSPTYITVGEQGKRSALIADIFTSGAYGPYYLATGRPFLMITLIDDANGKRAAIGPVYSTYEFYGQPFPSTAGRYTDNDRRSHYDNLTGKEKIMSLPLQTILSH